MYKVKWLLLWQEADISQMNIQYCKCTHGPEDVTDWQPEEEQIPIYDMQHEK